MNSPSIRAAVQRLGAALPSTGVRAAILFGSAAREEAADESDIDLLILPRPGRSEERALREVRAVEDRDNVRCSVLVSRAPGLVDLERQLAESILRHGVVLAGAMPSLTTEQLDLEPVRLLSLDLSGLPQAEKVRLERRLFGYESRRRHGSRVYRSGSPGLVRQRGGRKIGRSLVVIPEAAVPEVDRLLADVGARRSLLPAWVQRV